MIKTGYKVTTKLADGVEVSLVFGYPSDVVYKKYHWTYPQNNCGPLGVFDTIESAKAILNDFSASLISPTIEIVLHECEYIPAIKCNNFWSADQQGNTECSNLCPKGNVFAAAIRLLS